MQNVEDTHATETHAAKGKELDPEAMTTLVIEGFWGGLARRLEQPQTSDAWAQMRRLAGELEREEGARVVDAPATINLRIGCAVLAAYLALKASRPAEELLDILEQSFVAGAGEMIREHTARFLDDAPDPFQAMVGVSKARERYGFGDGFTFERERDDDRAYLLNVRRCFWHDLFVGRGAPELTRVLCAFDTNWIAAIDPKRHRLRFERPTTLGLGGDRCAFHFRREGGDAISSGDGPKDC